MVFLTIEDLLGTVEVVVFPRQYEIYRNSITQDGKLFIQGHVSAEEEKASKLICDRIWKFEDLPKEIWIQFRIGRVLQRKKKSYTKFYVRRMDQIRLWSTFVPRNL